ncbi:putative protein 1 [Dougjudy virga-like virus]|nr:putative protein 1 [Dougjudy virga-like virus]
MADEIVVVNGAGQPEPASNISATRKRRRVRIRARPQLVRRTKIKRNAQNASQPVQNKRKKGKGLIVMVEILGEAAIKAVSDPVTMLFVLGSFIFLFSEVFETSGPLEMVLEFIKSGLAKEPNALESLLLNVFKWLFGFLVDYKFKVAGILVHAIPVVIFRDKSAYVVFTICSLIVLIFRQFTVLTHSITSGFVWAMRSLNKPIHRFMLVVIYSALLIIVLSVVHTAPQITVTRNVNKAKGQMPSARKGPNETLTKD